MSTSSRRTPSVIARIEWSLLGAAAATTTWLIFDGLGAPELGLSLESLAVVGWATVKMMA